jgi:S1-C subfamily serine protease
MASNYRSASRRQNSSFFWPLLPLLALLAVGVFLVWRLWPSGQPLIDPQIQARTPAPRGNLADDEKATIELFRSSSPSVVHILTTMADRRDFFSFNQQLIPRGTGSGIIWKRDERNQQKREGGYVVTNYHVIEGATSADVTLADHSTWKARAVGASLHHDIAVLWIGAPWDRLPPIRLGESHNLQVGQKVFAIGNPFGLDHSLTTGVISALGREITGDHGRPLKGAIQTDAAINPGNSGGPLLDSAGRLIGVNAAILSPSKASAGIGFAIPVDDVNRVVTELIQHGKLVRPGLGIDEVPEQIAQKLGIEGVLILNVTPGGSAARAGLQATRRDRLGRLKLGDVIVALDGAKVTSSQELFDILDRHKVGDAITVTVLRDGQRRDFSVVLQAEEEAG